MPSYRIRQYKTRKDTERSPQETKKTVYNKKETKRHPRERKNKRNGTTSARNENERENRIKRKQAQQLRAKSKIKNNKHGKFEPSQFTGKENSDNPRINQAHRTR